MGLLSPLRDQVISCTRPSQKSWPEPVPVVRTDWRPLSSPLMADTSVRYIRPAVFRHPVAPGLGIVSKDTGLIVGKAHGDGLRRLA